MTSSVSETVAHATSRDGTRLAYWQSGAGRPLLLVHGGTSDHTRWASMLHLLEPHAAVAAMDRRGRGGSGDAEDYAIEREFEDVAAVIDALAADAGAPVDVFGHSLGALCALEASLLTPNVRRVASYEAPTHWQPPQQFTDRLAVLEALVAEGRRDEAVELFFREAVRSPEDEIALLRATPAWAARVASVHTLLREIRALSSYRFDATKFASLPLPVLLLSGDAHAEGPQMAELRAGLEAFADSLPDARVAVLAGQQHMAADTAPELLADILGSFFEW